MASHQTLCGSGVPDDPQITVITPCYNGLPYLREAIASVEKLAESVRLEHIVADGGSSDGSVEILAQSPYVRGVSQPDAGLYAAANWAIEQARAPLLQWMNADDAICPRFVARAVALMSEFTHIDAVLGSTQFIDADGKNGARWTYDPFLASSIWARAEGYFFNINSAVYRTSTLRTTGLFDQHRFPVAADLEFQQRFLSATPPPHIVVLDEPAYRFRCHTASLTQGENARDVVTQSNANLYSFWSQQQSMDPELRREFLIMAVELQMGWALKCLRTGRGGGRRAALEALRELIRENPQELRAALPVWLRKRVFDPRRRLRGR